MGIEKQQMGGADEAWAGRTLAGRWQGAGWMLGWAPLAVGIKGLGALAVSREEGVCVCCLPSIAGGLRVSCWDPTNGGASNPPGWTRLGLAYAASKYHYFAWSGLVVSGVDEAVRTAAWPEQLEDAGKIQQNTLRGG